MTCHECQALLVLSESGQESPEARDHLAGCVTCRQLIHDNEKLQFHLRRVAAGERAPEALRKQVEAFVRRPISIRRVRTRLWAGIAAGVIILVLAGYGLVRHHLHFSLTPSSLAQDFILDHEHYLPGRQEIVTNSPQDVQDWFEGKVDFPVRVPRLSAAALVEARVCTIAGRKAALVHYRLKPQNTLVSFFVAPEPKTFERQKKPIVLFSSYEGLNSTLWCHRGLVYSLVASLDDRTLQQIAKSVQQQEP
ncbi:MAG: anti-sigma factor family protein [Terriglobia bacterium]